MASDSVYSAIRTHLETAWTATPLVFENEGDAPDFTPWVYVEAAGGFYDAASIGAGTPQDNLYREEGVVFLWIFVPGGTGTTLARQYAKQMADVFRGLELSAGTLRFESMSIVLGESTERDGPWWRIGVTVDYQKDHTG